jgi:SanA protein
MQYITKNIWKLVKYGGIAASLVALLIFMGNYWVTSSVEGLIHEDIEEVSYSDVALVLGTSRSINGRVENPFFTHRITAAAELYFAGKVKHILVSGDNSTVKYNEPRDMKKALIARGVPAHCITMDFAGLRTLDSVVRSNKIFQQQRLTIVSQSFHNYRALFIAQKYGIDAVAYNAAYPKYASNRTIYREYLARVKAVLDLYVFGTAPKFLGEKVDIRV